MNATQKLFDRFEKSGPSWLPIIVLSTIGIIVTAVCVQLIAAVSEKEFPQKVQEVYLAFRDIGREQTMLFEVSEIKLKSLSGDERELIEKWKPIWTDVSFFGGVMFSPSFPPDDITETGRPQTNASPSRKIVAVWNTADSKTILLSVMDRTAVDQTKFNKLIAISKNQSELIATSTNSKATDSSDGDYGEFELQIEADPENPAVLAVLLDAHGKRQGNTEWDEIKSESLVGVVQDYLNLSAFSFVNDQGLESISESDRLESETLESDSDRKNILFAAIDLGTRNGVSKQYDQYVMTRMSRDKESSAVRAASERIVIHPLSCPIHIDSTINGIPADETRSISVFENDWIVPRRDVPFDLIQQLTQLSANSLDLRSLAQDLRSQLNENQQYEMIFEMQEPFPATVYQRKPSND